MKFVNKQNKKYNIVFEGNSIFCDGGCNCDNCNFYYRITYDDIKNHSEKWRDLLINEPELLELLIKLFALKAFI